MKWRSSRKGAREKLPSKWQMTCEALGAPEHGQRNSSFARSVSWMSAKTLMPILISNEGGLTMTRKHLTRKQWTWLFFATIILASIGLVINFYLNIPT